MRWRRKTGVVFLVMALLVTGCMEQAGQQAPELQEPVSRNSACRPVEMGKIGKVEVLLATVVSKEYGHFYQSDVTVEDIKVEVGDHVRKGDILAHAGTREEKKRKKELEEELVQEQKKFVWQEKITEQRKEEIRLAGEKGAKKQLVLLKEDARYERELYEQRVKELEEGIEEEEKKIQAGLLRAKQDGYMTYRKDLAVAAGAAACENVVVIADRKQQVLEVTDQTIDKYGYSGYEVKYIISGGKQIAVKEISYTEKEMMAARKSKSYPPVRFTCQGDVELSAGDSCLIYFLEKRASEVLVVGNDSIHTQGKEQYVYVRNEEGKEEKRLVETGRKDDYRTEIKSGLKEGELVCYTSSAVLPSDHGNYTAERTEYEVRSRTGSCRFADASSYVVTSELEGMVVENTVADGDKIKKGKLLYVIDTGKTKAVLTELSNQILGERDSYRDTVRERKKQAAAELKGKKGKYREAVKKRLQYEKELAAYIHTCTLRQLERQYKEYKEGNAGDGKVRVYAKHNGKAANCQIKVGEKIVAGTYLFSLERQDKKRFLILQIPPLKPQPKVEKRTANVGERITFVVSDKKYSGTCTGYTVSSENENRVYLSTEKGKGYLSKNMASSFMDPGYYVELDKEQTPGQLPEVATYAAVHLKEVLTVPVSCVHEEVIGEGRSDWYVWRVVKDQLVKQYVTLNEELNNGVDQVIFSGLEPGDVIAA